MNPVTSSHLLAATATDQSNRAGYIISGRTPDQILNRIYGSAYQKYRTAWERAGQRQDPPPFPLHLDIDTNYSCNLACIMCPQGQGGFPVSYDRKFLDFHLYERVLSEGVDNGLAAVRLGITGEPLLRADISEFVVLAKRLGILDIMLITNGQLLDEDIAANLMDAGLTRLMVSIDAFQPATYRRLRPGGELSRLENNLDRFLALRQKRGTELPLLRVSFVKTSFNWQEQDHFRQRWQNRADYICFQEYSNILGRADTTFYGPEPPRISDFRCPDPWQRLSLFVNGDMFPCCSDFGRLAPLSNATHTSVSQAWHSPAATRLRDHHRQDRWFEVPVCRQCGLASRAMPERVSR